MRIYQKFITRETHVPIMTPEAEFLIRNIPVTMIYKDPHKRAFEFDMNTVAEYSYYSEITHTTFCFN